MHIDRYNKLIVWLKWWNRHCKEGVCSFTDSAKRQAAKWAELR